MNEQTLQFVRALSRLLGWIYTLSWSASFYPQPYINWKRKSTHGLTVDYPFLNVIGFTCYTISTSCLLYSGVIRRQYAARHPEAPLPTVRVNDLVYVVHALVMLWVTYSQFFPKIWGFEVSKRQNISRPVAVISTLCLLGTLIVGAVVVGTNGIAGQNPSQWAWIDVISAIGYCKLVVTFVKYVPQAWLNYQRKSTAGWSIEQILLDVLGGVLSMMQLGIDASVQHNWKDVVDNPVKLGLANISIFFDLIFITQHYLLYPQRTIEKTSGEESDSRQPLLDASTQVRQ